MPRFAANLSLLFTERPLLDRFAAAREAGFAAVEIQFPQTIVLDFISGTIVYAGVVGCEYVPAAGTEAGLGWMAAYRG